MDSLPDPELPRRYDAAGIKERTRQIGRRLAECGYPFARITVAIASTADDSLFVRYHVFPDRKCLFAAPRLIGAASTKQALLLHDVLVRRGDLFDVRKIDASREALGRRPYIVRATTGGISVRPLALRDPDDSSSNRDVDYVSVPLQIKDRSGLSMEGALGINSRQGDETFLQGDLTFAFLNVFHAGEQASLNYAGDKTYQKFNVHASKPWLFGYPLIVSSGFGLEIREGAFGYLEGKAQVSTELAKNWHAGIGAKGSETTLYSTKQSWRYAGIDFLMTRLSNPLHRGVFERELSFSTGSGIASRERNYTRSHVDFSTGIHQPLFDRHALRVRFSLKHLITRERTLTDAEMYRVGGYRSVRGYLENEFVFRTVAYDQLEYHYYFSPMGSAYIFCDNGAGFADSLSRIRWNQRNEFLGYGLGIRVSARVGMVTIEWARNRLDRRSLGRLHFQVSNTINSGEVE
jgi:outer membrane protein assembly factor BamA